MFSKSLVFLLTVLVFEAKCTPKKVFDFKGCDLGPLVKEIASYEDVVKKIIDYTVSGAFKGKTYDEWVLLHIVLVPLLNWIFEGFHLEIYFKIEVQ